MTDDCMDWDKSQLLHCYCLLLYLSYYYSYYVDISITKFVYLDVNNLITILLIIVIVIDKSSS
jgi:hypothetical protein